QGEAGFFSAGQDLNRLVNIVLAEKKRAEDRAGLLLGELVFVRAQLHHVLENRQIGLEIIESVLGEVADDDVAAEFADATLDREHIRENFEERGLAGAIGSDEHDALAALTREIQVTVDDMIAVRLLDVFELDYFQAGTRRLGKLEV